MKEETLAHWHRMCDDARSCYETNGEAPIGRYCTYCQKYYDCKGCPIFEKTGLPGCLGTPYNDANEAWCNYLDSAWNESKRLWWQLKADAMIKFLEDL